MSNYVSDGYVNVNYFQTGLSADWKNKIIHVPQSYLTSLGSDSFELDTEAFKIDLRNLEQSEAGIAQADILNHNTSVSLSGIEYARIIEITNGYTITFEATGSPYRVFLKGSNNNILDVTNLNEAVVAPNNSAGLINLSEIQQVIFQDRAWKFTIGWR